MANQRSTFGKRQREQNRKDKSRQKQERLAARRSEVRVGKGPPIASFAEADAAIAAGAPAHDDSLPDSEISAPEPASLRDGDSVNHGAPDERPAMPASGTPGRR